MTTIERSHGICVGGFFPGGGYSGLTDDLDSVVQAAAEALREAYGMDIQIRFNSCRESGGAWLVTDPGPDAIGKNNQIGICARFRYIPDPNSSDEFARIRTNEIVVEAHIGNRSLAVPEIANNWTDRPDCSYYHGEQVSIAAALAFVLANGTVRPVTA